MSKRQHEPIRAPSDANGEDKRIFNHMPTFKIPKLAAVVCSSAPEGAQVGKDEAPASSNPAYHVPSPPARDSHTEKMSPPPPDFRNRSYFPPRRPITPKPSRSASSSSSSSSTSVRSPPIFVTPSRFPPSLRSADLATFPRFHAVQTTPNPLGPPCAYAQHGGAPLNSPGRTRRARGFAFSDGPLAPRDKSANVLCAGRVAALDWRSVFASAPAQSVQSAAEDLNGRAPASVANATRGMIKFEKDQIGHFSFCTPPFLFLSSSPSPSTFC
ncbi:hypothetical protein niasHT_026016 [Heterodera trifolii]|uniref:Uncharacterized protein n=1 Tax=Heterodera trifolii TaxID=157864 RepID=A0ABD2JZU2_9BILA